MDKAEVLYRNHWVEINIDDFAQIVKGILRKSYPPLGCLACEKPVHNSGLVTPNPDFRIQCLQKMENFVH